jgi:UDP-N-acetylmuramate--alanine ligase
VSITVPAGVKASTNAAGAIAIAREVGVDFEPAVRALAAFGGVARRFQYRGERAGVTYIDDYAHLPTEVAAAIAAAKQGPWRRVIVVFQPHRYTRTASIGPQFADAFSAADTLVLTDVYPAGETPIPGVSGRLILHVVLDHHPELAVAYLPRPVDLAVVPERYARPGDLVLTLGAGDLTTMPDVWQGVGA